MPFRCCPRPSLLNPGCLHGFPYLAIDLPTGRILAVVSKVVNFLCNPGLFLHLKEVRKINVQIARTMIHP